MTEGAQSEAAFLALATRGATHEVRNVLAIIKESAGLAEDLVRTCPNRGALDEERLSRATQRIESQVKRGAEILTNLNRLAHLLGRNADTVDLFEEIEFVVALAQRVARQASRKILAERRAPKAGLYVNPFKLQMALFATVRCGLNLVPEGGSVVLRSAEHQGLPSVEVVEACEPPAEPLDVRNTEQWERLTQLLGALGAEAQPTAAGFRVVFSQSP
jgi:signal transduction histidine kinase